MREPVAAQPAAPVRDKLASVPWLAFSIHHDGRGRRQDSAGVLLAAEACLHGTIAILVGPSGAGKSSLLRGIAGLLRPGRGYVRVNGRTVWNSEAATWVSPARRGCGLVTQRPALFPAMSVAGNIAFGLDHLPRVERLRRVEEMAALFRIEALLPRRPRQLSGGEQQRVAVARTLAPRPCVLLLDEPFAGLNLALKDAILADLEMWLKATGTPALYVTHDVAEAWKLGRQPQAEMLRLEAGRIVRHGSPATVMAEERAQLLTALE